MRRLRMYSESKIFIISLFLSYFIFLITNGIGHIKYSYKKNLNMFQTKLKDMDDKHRYLLDNIDIGDIEENNRELMYIEEIRSEILQNVKEEGAFWLVDFKKLIKDREDELIKSCFEGGGTTYDSKYYFKLKNELDEFNFYYKMKEKPLEYTDNNFMKYFLGVFNSKIHNIFLTIIIIGVCSILILNKDKNGYSFIKSIFITIIPLLCIQLFNLIVWICSSSRINLFYPVRVLNMDYIKNMLSLGEGSLEQIIPFYKFVILVILFQIMYVILILTFIKIINLFIESKIVSIIVVGFSFIVLFLISFTRFSTYSFFSYIKFSDIVRGYESIYKANKNLSINAFGLILLSTLLVCFIVYLYKRYIIGEEY